MDGGVWIALIGLIVQLITGGAQQLVGRLSGELRGQLLTISKDLVTKLNKNNSLKEKFLTAISERNNALMTAMMQGMGFGARAKSIVKELEANKALQQEGITYYNNNATKLDALINDANNAANNAGTLTGYYSGKGVAAGLQEEAGKIEDPKDLTQNINGGISNEIQK